MRCYRHYDEETGLYTATFFGVMTAQDFYAERSVFYADLARHSPRLVLLDYSICHPKVSPFELQRLAETERWELYEAGHTAMIMNTAWKKGLLNMYLQVAGAIGYIHGFSSLVDAKLWLNSRPNQVAAAVGSRSLGLLGLILLATAMGSTFPQAPHNYATTKPAKTAVARMISPASTKS